MRLAVGISLTTVIATSSVVSAGRARPAADQPPPGHAARGGDGGGRSCRRHRRVDDVAADTAAALRRRDRGRPRSVMLGRLDRRNVILDPEADTGRLGRPLPRRREPRHGGLPRAAPAAGAGGVSLVAGSVSSLLGLGGGIMKVPALNAWCGVPLRVAAATSAFMIGVTATAGAVIYYGRGEIVPVDGGVDGARRAGGIARRLLDRHARPGQVAEADAGHRSGRRLRPDVPEGTMTAGIDTSRLERLLGRGSRRGRARQHGTAGCGPHPLARGASIAAVRPADVSRPRAFSLRRPSRASSFRSSSTHVSATGCSSS